MPHVTFIHGIANKPPPADLLTIWRRALADAPEPCPLNSLGVTSSQVYWADLLNEKPEADLSSYEGVLENTAGAVDGAGAPSAPPIPASAEEGAFLKALRAKLTTRDDADLDTDEPPSARPADPNAGALERVPLPWFLKKRFMDAFLRDVHHYLFDVEFGPPGKPAVRIQQTIRNLLVQALSDPSISRPHVVVSHSMGTVIAYDCLKRVAQCPGIDGLITIGSPLGLDEVQDKLQPGWSREQGYPSERVAGDWINLYDRLDPVCGFDPLLANDFGRRGGHAVEDVVVQNNGVWRHSATKYLRQPEVVRSLRRLLGV